MDGAPVQTTAAGGEVLTSVEHTVHERRLRAFAASIGDLSAPLFDLDSPRGIVAHPVFPVCLEWPLILAGPPGLGLDDDAVHAGLHVSHEIAWTRPIRPGDTLRTTLRVETLQQRSAGVLAVFAFTTTADGEPVVESRQGVLYRGSALAVAAIDTSTPRPTHPSPAEPPSDVATFQVAAADAVIYSECSGIWNPIHTDPRAARTAGLSRPVLHGTATLARVVSALTETRLAGDPTSIARLGCRFTAPISPGDRATVSSTELHPLPNGGQAFTFTARKDPDVRILDEGFVEVAPA